MEEILHIVTADETIEIGHYITIYINKDGETRIRKTLPADLAPTPTRVYNKQAYEKRGEMANSI